MAIQTVTDAIRYVGVDDNTLALFENQYPVQPMGVSYNSYVILDEKIAVMDSVDARAAHPGVVFRRLLRDLFCHRCAHQHTCGCDGCSVLVAGCGLGGMFR